MPEVICNTSPIQYLHQLGLLHILHALAGEVIVPPAVVEELAEGRASGVSLPDVTALQWIAVRDGREAGGLGRWGGGRGRGGGGGP